MPPARRRRQLDPEAETARATAEQELQQLRKGVEDAEEEVKRRKKLLAEGIARHVGSRVLTPTEAGDASGYDRVYASKLARAGGAAPHRDVEPPQVRKKQDD